MLGIINHSRVLRVSEIERWSVEWERGIILVVVVGYAVASVDRRDVGVLLDKTVRFCIPPPLSSLALTLPYTSYVKYVYFYIIFYICITLF